MKKIYNYVFVSCFLLITSLFVSCNVQPNPLVGAWADNQGNTISLFADNTFLAKITSSGKESTIEGTYNVLLNVITFITSSGHQRVSEWDIRGNMLYINWTDDVGNSIPLTLYKIRN